MTDETFIPPLPAEDVVGLPAEVAEGEPAINLWPDVSVPGLIGAPAAPVLAAWPDWDDATLFRYVRYRRSSWARDVDGEFFGIGWATLAAILRVPVYIEAPLPHARGGLQVGLISARGQVQTRILDVDATDPLDASLPARAAARASLFAGELDATGLESFVYAQKRTGRLPANVLEIQHDVRVAFILELPHDSGPRGGSGHLTDESLEFPDLEASTDSSAAGLPIARVHAHGSTGSDSVYEIRLAAPVGDGDSVDPTPLFTCTVDGEPRALVDRFTYEDHGSVHPALDWFRWILGESRRHRATSPERAQRPFDGDSLDAVLMRAERGITRYDDHERATSSFTDAAHLQAWLDDILQDSPARIVVSELDSHAFEIAHPEASVLEEHVYDRMGAGANGAGGNIGPGEPGFRQRWAARAVAPWMPPEAWYGDAPHSPAHPFLDLRMEGALIERYHADWCSLEEDLTHYLSTSPGTDDRWFVLHLVGTPTMLPFPREDTMLRVYTDDDGAMVYISLRHLPRRVIELRSEETFRIRWAAWLAADHPLDPAVAHETRERIERSMTAAIEGAGA